MHADRFLTNPNINLMYILQHVEIIQVKSRVEGMAPHQFG